jgi:hypothetical protein
MRRTIAALGLTLATAPALADPAVIEAVTADLRGGGWHFTVTLSHGDTGWDDYADGWRVVDVVSGTVYGTRVLVHPHVTEQPFTRSLSEVAIPYGVDAVMIEERTTVTDWGAGQAVRVPLPRG